MDFIVNIEDDKIDNVSHNGKTELKKLSKEFIEEVLDEAGRIEEANNTSTTSANEITASFIRDSYNFARRFHVRTNSSKKEKWLIPVQLTALISMCITGGLFSKADFSKTEDLVIFLIVFFIAIATSVLLIYKEATNGK